MVLLITAHNTFSGRAQSSSGTMDEQGGSRHVHIHIMHVYVCGVFKHMCTDNFHVTGCVRFFDFLCVCMCVCMRDLCRGGSSAQAGKCRQLLESLQGVYGATAQVPRTSGWIS